MFILGVGNSRRMLVQIIQIWRLSARTDQVCCERIFLFGNVIYLFYYTKVVYNNNADYTLASTTQVPPHSTQVLI